MKKKAAQNENFAKRKKHIARKILIVSGGLVFIAAFICLSIFL
jgi:hypothetical protein